MMTIKLNLEVLNNSIELNFCCPECENNSFFPQGLQSNKGKIEVEIIDNSIKIECTKCRTQYNLILPEMQKIHDININTHIKF